MRQVELPDRVARHGRPFPHIELHQFGVGAAEPFAADGVALDYEAGDIAGSNEFLVDDGVDANVLREADEARVLDQADRNWRGCPAFMNSE